MVIIVLIIIYFENHIPDEKPLRQASIKFEYDNNLIPIKAPNENYKKEALSLLNKLLKSNERFVMEHKQTMVSIEESGKWSRTKDSIKYSYKLFHNITVHKINQASIIPDGHKYYITLTQNNNLLWKKRIVGFDYLLLSDNKNILFYIDYSGSLCARDIFTGDLIYSYKVTGGFATNQKYTNYYNKLSKKFADEPIFYKKYLFLNGNYEEIDHEKYNDNISHSIPIVNYILQLE